MIVKIIEARVSNNVRVYWNGNRISLDEIIFCNLAKAINDPEKVIPPIISPNVLSINFCEKDKASERVMQTAARPPSPLKIAIIWGNAVIFTLIEE